ncbi:hypothetical protein NDU88_006154 [Pleurodeles waltl]|uniref:Uncharacterized protein n=1 Tax=Pleurodeles waltl TaxID=8319 RepID=A0AAV7LN90_PLEWA|nr:hypothetical protein NDU88_006154 [Pleurodeles waltl]
MLSVPSVCQIKSFGGQPLAPPPVRDCCVAVVRQRSTTGRIHHQAAADQPHWMMGRAQQRPLHPMGHFPVPCRVRAASGAPARGPRDSLAQCWALPGSRVLRGSQFHCWLESRGAPGYLPVQLRAPPVPARSPLPPAPSHCLLRRRSTQASGFRAELRCAPRPLSLRRAGVLRGTKFWFCHFPPGQANLVCVDYPAGPREELYVRISWQAPSEPLDYAPDILAGLARAMWLFMAK